LAFDDTKAVILAAGLGTRMKSDLLKVLHPLAGRPMIRHVLSALDQAGVGEKVIVTGHQSERLRETVSAFDGHTGFVLQEDQLGTGHAARQAESEVGGAARVLILCGDTPLLDPRDLRRLVEAVTSDAVAAVLTAEVEDPAGYGRILRGPDDTVGRIVEEVNCTEAEARVREINSGVYCCRAGLLFATLRDLRPDPVSGEIYLTDIVDRFVAGGRRVRAVRAMDPVSIHGVNDRRDLALAGKHLRRRLLDALMVDGVTVVDPETTFVDYGVTVGPDTRIEPGTHLKGATRVGARCVLGPNAWIEDATIGDDVRVFMSVVSGSRVESRTTVGPFSHVRPGTRLAEGVRVGNFAELKNSVVGAGSKVSHHSYIGDTDIGEGVNIGAGTVTVNYDGRAKHRTDIRDGAFVGCNSNIIAPVTVGRNAYIAAGSTVTQDVPDGALAIARNRQENKEGWVSKRTAQEES